MKRYLSDWIMVTDSVRAVLVDSDNGSEIASEVFWYPRLEKSRILRCLNKSIPTTPFRSY